MHVNAKSETGSQEVVGSSPIASTAKAPAARAILCDPHAGVAEHLLNDLGLDASGEHLAGRGVPRVVEADPGEPGLPDEVVEAGRDPVRRQRFPELVGEHVARWVPAEAECHPLLELGTPGRREEGHEVLVEGYGAAATLRVRRRLLRSPVDEEPGHRHLEGPAASVACRR